MGIHFQMAVLEDRYGEHQIDLQSAHLDSVQHEKSRDRQTYTTILQRSLHLLRYFVPDFLFAFVSLVSSRKQK